MKKNEIVEVSAAMDKAVGTAKDVAGGANLAATVAHYAPKIPGAIKTIGKKALPGLNVAYQTLDAAKRATADDDVGAAIAGASAIPALSIVGPVVQAGRDKIRTGSFLPTDDEIKAAAKKDKEAGGYWKARGSDYDPSYMPESKVMKSNRLQAAIIKEELALKKCSLSEEDLKNTLFIYKDRQGNLFTESGKQIDTNRLDEGGMDALKSGWNAVKAGGQWAAKNIPPAYRAVKSGIGKTADEIGNVYQAGKKAATAVGNELVDIPTNTAKKLKGAYQDIRYGTTPDMDPAQRIAHISDYKSRAAMADLDAAEIARQKGLNKADIQVRKAEADKIGAEADSVKRQGKAAADVQSATASDIEAKRPMDWKPAKKAAIGTGVVGGVDALAGGVDIDPDQGTTYEPGRGIRRLAPKLDEVSLWDYMFGKGDKDKPKPKPPVKPEVTPEPVKPAEVPVKPEKPAEVPVKPEKPAEVPVKPEKPAEVPVKPAKSDDKDGLDVPHNNLSPDYVPPRTNSGSDKVRAMQQKLKAAGYDIGNFGPDGSGVDGKWGRKTQSAYDAYKADQKLKRSGEPDAASIERERIAAQSNANRAPQGSDTTVSGASDQSDDPIGDIIKAKQASQVSPASSDPASSSYDQRAARAMSSKSPEVDDANKVIPESVNTELKDILWLAGRQKR